MNQIFEKNFIPTKEAAELSGYTSDYLARLARSGKISAKRVGHTWLVDTESLTLFLDQQGDRKIDYARALARAREEEYRTRNSPLQQATNTLTKPLQMPEKLGVVVNAFRTHALAVSLSLAVVVSGAVVARAEAIPFVADKISEIAGEINFGFKETFGNIPSRIVARIEKAESDMRSVSPALKIAEASISNPFANFDLDSLQMAIAENHSEQRQVSSKQKISFSAEPITFESLQSSAFDIYNFVTEPSLAYQTIGTKIYGAIISSLSYYHSLIENSGTETLSLASHTRDAVATAPRIVSEINLAFGNAIIRVAHSAVYAETKLAYVLAEMAPKSARAVVALMGETGAIVADGVSRTPALATNLFLRATEIPSNAAPAIASAVFNAEYGVSARFVKDTQAISNNYLSVVNTAGRLYHDSSLALRDLGEDGPSVIQDAYLATLGKSALALDSFSKVPKVAAVISVTRSATAPILATVEPALTVGQQIAFTTYKTVRGWLDSTNRALAILLGPPPTIVLPTTAPRARSLTIDTPSQSRQSSGISYPTYTTVVKGVSEDFVNQSLASLRSDILATTAGLIRPVYTQTVTNAATTQSVNRIEDLSNLIVRNGDFRGGVFDNGERVSAKTGTFTNSLNAGTTTLAGTTITGDLSVSGTITPGIIAATNYISAPYFVATSTTATSTFAGSLAIGTTTPFDYGLFTVGTTTPLLYIDRNSGKIGIGTSTPTSRLAIFDTSTQLRLNYNASNYADFTVSSDGAILLSPTNSATTTIANAFQAASSLYVLNNGNVGLGTTTPLSKLVVSGNQSIGADYNIAAPVNGLIVQGSVGIGTTTPGTTFAVAGTGLFNGALTSFGVHTAPYFTATTSTATSTFSGGLSAGNNAAFVVNQGATANSLYINNSGNVGIATTSPSATFAVHGNQYTSGTGFFGGALTATSSLVFSNFTGILSSNGTSGVSARTLTGTANQITITNGDGTAGNPTFSLPSLLAFTNASTSQLSVFQKAYFGGTSTTTIDSAGSITLPTVALLTAPYASTTMVTATTASTTNLTVSSLTLNRVPYITTANAFTDSANLTFDGTTLTPANLTVTTNTTLSNLTASRLVATDGSKILVSTITAGNLLSSVTGTTGTAGNLVFSTSPTISDPTLTGLSSINFASSTLFSANQAYFGTTATSTFSSGGSLTLPSTALLTAPYASTTMITATTASTTNLIASGAVTFQNLIGMLSSNGTSGTSARTLTGTANQITIANGDGTGGNPTFSLPSTLSFTDATSTNLFAGRLTANTFSAGQTASTTVDSAGNLTVGGTLTVAGLCVTGDTRLRRRRKARKGEEDEADEDGYIYDEVMIKDIKEGDEIQSLDEKTGKLVWSKVKQLAYMGVKQTYKLTTESGKTIRTTANHPYLARKAKNKASPRAVAFIDFANVKAGYRDRGYRTIDLEVLYSELSAAGVTTTRFYYGTDVRNEKSSSFFTKIASFGYAVVTKPVQYFNISFLGLLEKPFNRRWIEALPVGLRANLLREAGRLDMIGVRLLQPKANFDVEITADALKLADIYDDFILFSGDGDFVPLVKRLRELGRNVTVVSDRKYLSGELLLAADKFVTLGLLNNFVPGLLLGDGGVTQNPPRGRVLKKGLVSIADLLGLSSAQKADVDNPVKHGEGSWRKVSELKDGMEIAVAAPRSGAAWDRIVSVEPVAEEDVYDIEVEGTHNFIGNDIVAHNTAIFNQASSTLFSANSAYFGATATSSFSSAGVLTLATDLAVTEGGTGASTLTGLLQGNGTSAITGITNSSTAGQVLRVTGASTYAWGALDLADTDAITGDLPFANLAQVSANSVLGNITGGTADATSIATSSLFTWSGTGDVVRTTSPTLVTPALGTPSALVLTNATGLPVGGGGTGQTSFTSGNLLYGAGTGAVQSVATSTVTFNNGIAVSAGSLGYQVGGSNVTIGIANNALTLAQLPQISAGYILGNNTGATANVTSFATSTLFGTGTGGQVLAWNNGVPQFIATTTIPLAGDVGGTLSATVIGANKVTLGMLATLAANSVIGNLTGSTATPTAVATSSLFTWSGTGDVVRTTSPTLVTPALGTPSALVLTNATGLPVAGGGTGASTLTGLLQGNGASAITGITGTAGQFPYYNGASTLLATSTIFLSTSGNVGIGTTGPGVKLDVLKDNTHAIRALSSGASAWTGYAADSGTVRGIFLADATYETNTGVVLIGSETNHNLRLRTNNLDRLAITNSGNVGIGTTGPGAKLHVNTAGSVLTDTAGTATGLFLTNNGTNGGIKIYPTVTGTTNSAIQSTDFANSINKEGGTPNTAFNLLLNPFGGNVGIGTTGPTSKLQVSGALTTNPTLELTNTSYGSGESSGENSILFGWANHKAARISAYKSATSQTGFKFYGESGFDTATAALMTIQSNGNVGIGTTAPDSIKLDVEDDIEIGTGTTGCVRDADNTTLVGTCVSDERLKKNIAGLSSGTLDKLAQLRPVTFEWRNDEFDWLNGQVGTNYGLIAQEVEPIFPDMIHTDDRGYKRVSYDIGLSMRLLEGIRELDARTRQILGADGVLSVVPGVESQCVTGDTRLRRRRKRADGSFEFDEIEIKNVVAGDEIQSLDERTGGVVYSRVNALVDMGTQEVFELVTKSGRRIRTTSNHPFLARMKAETV